MMAKSKTVTERIKKAIREGMKAVMEQERLSRANLIEIMILRYCRRSGVVITENGVGG